MTYYFREEHTNWIKLNPTTLKGAVIAASKKQFFQRTSLYVAIKNNDDDYKIVASKLDSALNNNKPKWEYF